MEIRMNIGYHERGFVDRHLTRVVALCVYEIE